MENFTPVSALIGGALIGLSAGLLLLLNGRIAGISGIIGGLLTAQRSEMPWRIAFLIGLLLGPLLVILTDPSVAPPQIATSWPVLIVGGLIVGFGTRMGGGCTSGHGVCGMANLSPRSIVATLLFMAMGAAVVFVVRHVIGA